MTSKGLRASPAGIKAAKTALTDKTLSQQKLAANLGITRQPVSKFFAGEPVSRSCFVQICQQLGLSWQEVVDLTEDGKAEAKLPPTGVDIDVLIQEVRQKRQDKIQDQCSTLQMLDIAQAIPLNEIYTDVRVWQEITSQQWQEIPDLLKELAVTGNFSEFGQVQHQPAFPALEALSKCAKLMVLGKPGSGKTTFLQYLAMQSNDAKLQPYRVPIFIKLKEFVEDRESDIEFSLGKYIVQQFLSCGVSEELTLSLLTGGKALILLDALDEVPLNFVEQVIKEIRKFTQTYYKNQFVITCRLAAQEYRFPGFTEVEIADFNDQQIECFVKKWFVNVGHQPYNQGEIAGNIFIQQLNLPEHQGLRELARRPILLHLLCMVFKYKMQFPHKLANLYEQALNILLSRWDEVRGIQRDDFYGSLTLGDKKKLLTYLSVNTFITGDYFFEQEKIEKLIYKYLYNLQNFPQPVIQLEQSTKAVLKGIESHDGLLVARAKGIDSFSHLALQEYLTAKYLIDNSQNHNWQLLIDHISDERWYQVLLLAVSMSSNAEEMLSLAKQKIDLLVAGDEKIANYLVWLYEKSLTIPNIEQAAVRAFYMVSDYVLFPTHNYVIEWDFLSNLEFNSELMLDQLLYSSLICAHQLESLGEYLMNEAYALKINLDEAIDIVNDIELRRELGILKKELISPEVSLDRLSLWWKNKGKIWHQQLKKVLIAYRNIGQIWQFKQSQIQIIRDYFQANKLLIDCLKYSRNDAFKQELMNDLFAIVK